MKYVLLSLVFVACLAKKPAPVGVTVETSPTPTPISSVDTLVPAAFDSEGKLIPLTLSEKVWRERLTAEAFRVLREEGTERAFTGKYWDNHESGIYLCAGCKLPLYGSEAKFDSGTGWPSFTQAIDNRYIKQNTDLSYGMARVEVECARCGGHLGHVFGDGPRPLGKRHCINSVSLVFVPDKK